MLESEVDSELEVSGADARKSKELSVAEPGLRADKSTRDLESSQRGLTAQRSRQCLSASLTPPSRPRSRTRRPQR